MSTNPGNEEPVVPTRFEPPASEASQPFWDASRDKRLVLPWCTDCGEAHWYPREVCTRCLGTAIEWRVATGAGTVYACSVMPKAALPMMADRVPYTVVLVDLDEGVRMMSNVVGCDPSEVTVGMAVKAAWEPLSDGRHLLVFEPS